MDSIDLFAEDNRDMRDMVRAMTNVGARFIDETPDLQLIKWEHEHFVNMVVNYGLTVETKDGEAFVQDPSWFTP